MTSRCSLGCDRQAPWGYSDGDVALRMCEQCWKARPAEMAIRDSVSEHAVWAAKRARRIALLQGRAKERAARAEGTHADD